MLKIATLIFLMAIHSQINCSEDDSKKRGRTLSSPTICLPPDLASPGPKMSLPNPLTSPAITSPEIGSCPSSVSTNPPSSGKPKRRHMLLGQFSPEPKSTAFVMPSFTEEDSSDDDLIVTAASAVLPPPPPPLRPITPLRMRTKSPTNIIIPDAEATDSVATDERPLTPINNPTLLDLFVDLAIDQFGKTPNNRFVFNIGKHKISASQSTNRFASPISTTFAVKLVNRTFLDAVAGSQGFKNAKLRHPTLEKFIQDLPVIPTPPASPK